MPKFSQLMSIWSDHMREACVRFPLSITTVLGMTIILWGVSFGLEDIASTDIRIRLLLGGVYLFFASTFATLLAESLQRPYFTWLFPLLALLDAIFIFFSLPRDLDVAPVFYIVRWALSVLVVVGLVCVVPFFSQKVSAKQVWMWLWTLFLRLCLVAIFSWAMFAGLSLAIGSLNILFSIEIAPEWFFRLGVTIGVLFAPWFFLAGVPTSVKKLKLNFHPALRVFTLFIGLPIVGVYMIILYAYSAKIIITNVWPEGGIIWLIFAFLVIGIFVTMLSYPLHLLETDRFQKMHRFFFWALLPIMVVYFLALYFRVDSYGWTDNRILVGVLGVWILVSSVLYLWKQHDLRIFFLVFSLLLLGAGWFPVFNMFDVSVHSQKNRLFQILREHELIDVSGMIVASETGNTKLPYDVVSIIEYLHDRDALDGVIEKIQTPLDLSELDRWEVSDTIVRAMGVDVMDRIHNPADTSEYFSINENDFEHELVHIDGYSSVRFVNSWSGMNEDKGYTYDADSGEFLIGDKTIDMHAIASGFRSLETPIRMYESKDVKIVFQHLSGSYKDGNWEYVDFNALVFEK